MRGDGESQGVGEGSFSGVRGHVWAISFIFNMGKKTGPAGSQRFENRNICWNAEQIVGKI